MKTAFRLFCLSFILLYQPLYGQSIRKMSFTVSMENPAEHRFHVTLTCEGVAGENLNFKLPAWTPGYYQLLNFADNIENFTVADGNNNDLPWEKLNRNTWQVKNNKATSFVIKYDVKTTRPFVATCYLDEERGYIMPAGVFMHLAENLKQPSTITILPNTWSNVATGLDSIKKGEPFTYTAPDFDVLYDSPILIGNLETLPSFAVNGITHRFIGYKLGDFDRAQLMSDLQKIVEASAKIIGDIPYNHYTFIAIGPGRGGIEHLNSTSFGFDGSSLNSREGKIRMLSFLAHEYFHHYNVKRIRPVELGPFDYDKGSRTNSLWVSEGLSVYYEYIVLMRAGLITQEELLELLRKNMIAFENKPGRLFQTLAQSSYETWSDGPFGRTNDDINKTISYYDKGPVVGMLLDFAIQHETGNKKSLDDVMRSLYTEYYQKKKRGFTEDELKDMIERTAGKTLPEIFEYIYSTKPLNYPKYLSYAGLAVDTSLHELPGSYIGLSTRQRNDSVFVSAVDWESPAMKAGLRNREVITEVEGQPATPALLSETLSAKKPGEKINLMVIQNNVPVKLELAITTKRERSFGMKPVAKPDPIQKSILDKWCNDKGVSIKKK
ncbi:MAG TPA: PDZ domain-containing protein [Cyclobacteriaceae bacterium]|nr:PDZ domain-containing protein [Cyclobacteriaceae bacterium]